MLLKNAWKHFKKICIHKYWVFYFCRICGLTYQGIIHDLSKFSITEFLENIKYYSDTKSPITIAKEQNGYALAWQHHKGRNPHHHVYWADNFDEGTTVIKMPMKYAIEQLCDWLAAGKAYTNAPMNTLFQREYEWWLKHKGKIAMHPQTIAFYDEILLSLKNCFDDNSRWKCLKEAKRIWKDVDLKFKDTFINVRPPLDIYSKKC